MNKTIVMVTHDPKAAGFARRSVHLEKGTPSERCQSMTITSFILRNALRNKRRFLLTVFSVALSLFLLTMLLVMLRGLTEPATTDEAALRIVVRHKVSLANMLFAKYTTRIEIMPGGTLSKTALVRGHLSGRKISFPSSPAMRTRYSGPVRGDNRSSSSRNSSVSEPPVSSASKRCDGLAGSSATRSR
jgi:hypothetical protein